jgi:diguanylate cyclase (GGDEF)-like protein
MQLRERIADFIYPEGRERRDQAERAANTDALTGLGNRLALDLALPTAEADSRTSVVFFDANNFGQVNKVVGDAEGDQMLRSIAASLCDTARRFGCGSRVFRKGGDEFVVLVPTFWAEKFRDRAEREFGVFRVGSVAVSLTGSVGQTLIAADSTLQARKREHKAAA